MTEHTAQGGNPVLTFGKDIFIGGFGAVRDMGKGLFNLVRHPLDSAKNIVMLPVVLVKNPGAIANVFINPYRTALDSGHPGQAIGRGIVEVGALVLAGKMLLGARHAGHAGAVAKAAGSADAASKAGHLGHAGAAGNLAKAGQAAEIAEVGPAGAAGLLSGASSTISKASVAAGLVAQAAHMVGHVGAAAGAAARATQAAGGASDPPGSEHASSHP
jgi:hypothetical protein